MALSTEQKIQILWDRDLISENAIDFCRALDIGDWPLYHSCFLDEFNVDFERLTGFPEVRCSADDWTEFARLILSPCKRHHQISGFKIKVDGDVASATIYMTARHFKLTDIGACENTQYGWYQNRYQRVGNGWKISHLKHYFQWVSGNGALLDVSEPALQKLMAHIFRPEARVAK